MALHLLELAAMAPHLRHPRPSQLCHRQDRIHHSTRLLWELRGHFLALMYLLRRHKPDWIPTAAEFPITWRRAVIRHTLPLLHRHPVAASSWMVTGSMSKGKLGKAEATGTGLVTAMHLTARVEEGMHQRGMARLLSVRCQRTEEPVLDIPELVLDILVGIPAYQVRMETTITCTTPMACMSSPLISSIMGRCHHHQLQGPFQHCRHTCKRMRRAREKRRRRTRRMAKRRRGLAVAEGMQPMHGSDCRMLE